MRNCYSCQKSRKIGWICKIAKLLTGRYLFGFRLRSKLVLFTCKAKTSLGYVWETKANYPNLQVLLRSAYLSARDPLNRIITWSHHTSFFFLLFLFLSNVSRKYTDEPKQWSNYKKKRKAVTSEHVSSGSLHAGKRVIPPLHPRHTVARAFVARDQRSTRGRVKVWKQSNLANSIYWVLLTYW